MEWQRERHGRIPDPRGAIPHYLSLVLAALHDGGRAFGIDFLVQLLLLRERGRVKISVSGFVEHNGSHERVTLLERMVLHQGSGFYRITGNNSGNNIVVI